MKGNNWENGFRSPLFIRWAGQFDAQKVSVPVKVEDLFPTLCHLAGIGIPDSLKLDGNILIDRKGQVLATGEPVFIAHHNPSGDSSYTSSKDPSGQAVPFTKEYISTFGFDSQRLALRKDDYKYIRESGDGQLFDLDSNPRELDEYELADDAIAGKMENDLQHWYRNIRSSEKAFTMPVFQIGYQKRRWTQIYACAPSAISEGLINKQHFLGNWGMPGDSAVYDINVHAEGEYDVYLVHEIEDFPEMLFQLRAGENTVNSWLTDSGNRDFGVLIEGERAYWNNFDLKETFRKSIVRSKLGSLFLSEHDKSLVLQLIDRTGEAKRSWDNRVIALQFELK
ncbi:sulfatase-like hydrolase/transferase [Marinilabilia rubra]|uniref:Sulfatase N-terminal domain-containing protein n=1 Tax=Marinilabilia rubra TaxID=2162893 RepID=A0A2U2B8L9_9BACT|nr:sulfatase-like hydrolase/transferase [Marinilabilia rubra]PWD99384.1 hypothetical protein DDZ16_10265 [Marinilabilia rubra]